MSIIGNPLLLGGDGSGGGGTVTITDTLDSVGGTIRTITTDPAATIVEALNITQNGTYTPSSGHAYGPVVAAVAGGGYTLLGEAEFTVNTTSATETKVGTISCGSAAITNAKLLMTTVVDKAGPRSGYFTSSLTIYRGTANTLSQDMSMYPIYYTNYYNSAYGNYLGNGYGVYGYVLKTTGDMDFYARYSSTGSRTINGTYLCQVWLLDYPTGYSPWGV